MISNPKETPVDIQNRGVKGHNVRPVSTVTTLWLKMYGSAKRIFLHDNDNSYVEIDCSKVKMIALL